MRESMSTRILLFLIVGALVGGSTDAQIPEPTKRVVLYPGTCEPSAAVMLEPGLFVVGDDDKEDLLVYEKGKPAKPKILEISALPGLKKKADLEGAARIGDAIYWIGSHSRKNNGKEDLDRHRLFAIKVKAGTLTAEAVGKPYERLLEDLQHDSRFEKFHLDAAAKLPPGQEGALNIEGLAARPDGSLLIGFRNPIPDGKALIVPLLNPSEVLAGKQPSFGDPIQLDLGGLGIRSLEHWPAADSYLIIAGSFEDGCRFQAFRWSGMANEKPQPIANAGLSLLVPEAVFFDPALPPELFILSDDGDACPEPEEMFRSRRVKLPS
jgi:uncharacterized protein DUF3616